MSVTPARWDRTIYRGTDHEWQFRRVTKDGETITPIIPTEATVTMRLNAQADEVWISPAVDIDPVTGWCTIRVESEATEGPEWDDRKQGVWRLDVTTGGNQYRWAQGKVTVDHG